MDNISLVLFLSMTLVAVLLLARLVRFINMYKDATNKIAYLNDKLIDSKSKLMDAEDQLIHVLDKLNNANTMEQMALQKTIDEQAALISKMKGSPVYARELIVEKVEVPIIQLKARYHGRTKFINKDEADRFKKQIVHQLESSILEQARGNIIFDENTDLMDNIHITAKLFVNKEV